MNYLKKFVLLLVTSSIILLNCVPVNASGLTYQQVNDWWLNKVDQVIDQGYQYQDWLKDVTSMAFDNVGFIIDKTGITIQKIKDAIHGVDNNQSSDMSDQDAYDWINNNISVSENNVVFGNQFNSFIKEYESDYVLNNRSFLYSFTIDEYASARNISTNLYLKIKEKIPEASDISNTVYFLKNTGNSIQVFSLDLYTYPYVYVRYGTSVSGIYGSFQLVNGYDNTNITLSGLGWNSTDQSFSNDVTDNGKVQGLLENIDIFTSPTGAWGNGSICFVSNHIRKSIRLFNGAATATDLLYQPYYYNNEVWQDFSKSSGDYIFSPSNINTVSYGDTISYIDNYIQDKGYPPTIPDININIENENNNNVNGGSGGGGSGGDDSGGGSGSDSPSDIFGWLKQLGAVLGSLIKGVGEFLTEIITGLVSAINSLLSGISDLIENITESLPTVFMDFLGTLFSWLPDEWVALFSACIIFMLLWGIIKTIRGS